MQSVAVVLKHAQTRLATFLPLHARIGMTIGINFPGHPMSVTEHYFNHE